MTTDLTVVRWGDGRRADSDFAREQILDSAWRCYKQNSVHKTRMDHIAREAKVSRTTIYRYFQNRHEVLMGVIIRALQTVNDQVFERVAATTSFAEFLVEVLVNEAELVPQSPVFSVLWDEEAVIMSRVKIGSGDIFIMMSKYFRPRFDAAKAAGEVRDGLDFESCMNWIIHVLSAAVHGGSPLRGSPAWRQMLWWFLVPAIVREEAIPADKRNST